MIIRDDGILKFLCVRYIYFKIINNENSNTKITCKVYIIYIQGFCLNLLSIKFSLNSGMYVKN